MTASISANPPSHLPHNIYAHRVAEWRQPRNPFSYHRHPARALYICVPLLQSLCPAVEISTGKIKPVTLWSVQDPYSPSPLCRSAFTYNIRPIILYNCWLFPFSITVVDVLRPKTTAVLNSYNHSLRQFCRHSISDNRDKRTDEKQ